MLRTVVDSQGEDHHGPRCGITVAENLGGRKRLSTNPFDDTDGRFVVLVNGAGQHSLWPVFAGVPAGWTVAFGGVGGADRDSALRFVDENWNDLRPRSLREATDNTATLA